MSQPPAFTALGTSWWIEIGDPVDVTTRTLIINECARLASTFSDQYSRFKSDSLVSQLNQRRTLENPPTEFIQLLVLGQQLYTITKGVFNCLLGEHLSARGYDSTYSFVPTPEPETLPNPLIDLTITDKEITLHAGAVDFGGYGKGYLIDQLANYLREQHHIQEFLINGGGDLYGTTLKGQPITVYLEHPTAVGQYLGTTTIMNQGFAASSPHKRTWTRDGVTHTHIVGQVNRDATFIIAPNAVIADALATTALLAPEAVLEDSLVATNGSMAGYSVTEKRLIQTPHFPFKPL